MNSVKTKLNSQDIDTFRTTTLGTEYSSISVSSSTQCILVDIIGDEQDELRLLIGNSCAVGLVKSHLLTLRNSIEKLSLISKCLKDGKKYRRLYSEVKYKKVKNKVEAKLVGKVINFSGESWLKKSKNYSHWGHDIFSFDLTLKPKDFKYFIESISEMTYFDKDEFIKMLEIDQ